MPKEEEKTEKVEEEPKAPEAKVETTPEEKPKEEPKEEFDLERAMATINKLREFEKEAKKLQKKVADYEKAEEERKRAEMSEMERLQADYEKAQAKLNRLTLEKTKRDIAAEVGLPAELALRIQGDDEEAMKADAQQLVEALKLDEEGKGEKPLIRPLNPSLKSRKGETDQERRRRLGYG